MDVKKIKYCFKCHKSIEPEIKFTETRVIQSCPICQFVLGMAGAFMISGYMQTLKMKVNLGEA